MLISATLIKCSVNFHALNFQYFWILSRHSWHLKNINYKLSFFPSTLHFSSFTKAKAKVYNNYFEFLFIVVTVRSDVNIFSFDFGQDRFLIVNIDRVCDRVWDLGTWLSFKFLGIQCWNKFVPVVTTNCVLISFIVKFYLLFPINFIYSKLIFH